MNIKKYLGIALLIIGLGCISFSVYIKEQVEQGRNEISEGQKTVDQTKSLFSLSPYTKPIGEGLANAGQSKIDAGTMQADQYEQIALYLKISGIALVILSGVSFFCFTKKMHR
jgi:hypothetical protein